MAGERDLVEVWADWDQLGEPRRVGMLQAIATRGKAVSSFEYDAEWLQSAPVAPLDPRLPLVRGRQFAGDRRESFGVFLDSSPDRWGRVLMQRREAQLAREAKRPERRLTELDYMLGVFDGHRLGGLRFRLSDGPFLDDNAELASPPWASLRELEQASLALEQTGAELDARYGAWLRMLIAPGRSLGGARPKASVLDPKGHLWLAKFPSLGDDHDVGGWEGVVQALARRAGIATADARLQKFGSPHHTFLARRFDRTSTRRRIHFASAMTLLDRRDGEDGACYLDLANVLHQQGANTARDLEQLWRRIAFFVCVSNVDDHLRNHGFLLEPDGWTLAPAYDMNPVPHGAGLFLNISETDNAQDLELVRDVATHFRVKPQRANEIITQILDVTREWRGEAKRAKLSRSEQDRMAPAFRLADASKSAK
ncbi:MAG: type II toxin-antitoxin system HipA family toxin [Deltaproteobacteria bacterium]|nr:type II toxin-antitoxin system HipA family toxin [Deltaproteobacteria bacterium]MDQ3298684.1 type II toxin-antitoxin system HipA family toxin [Myxococcota bacterium]